MPLSAGEKLGPYEILAPLGAGGMGDVYRARDVKLGREVALKVLSKAIADDPNYLRRFQEEARLASSLNHPNIVTIYGVGEEADVAYIAMELVRGRTLRKILAEGALPVQKVLDLAVQVAEALAAAHAGGIIHRDLKPENVMVTADERVKVLDFGLAKRQTDTIAGEYSENSVTCTDDIVTLTCLTGVGIILGTVGYMSPEQAAGRILTQATDQFPFGAILYEMLSGRRAFQRATPVETLAAIIHEQPARLQTLNAAVTAPLQQLVERCLAKNPEDRYPVTGNLAAHLHDIRDHWERADVPTAVMGNAALVSILDVRRERRVSRRRAVWLGGVSAASAVSGLTAWKLWPVGSGIRSLAVLPFQNAAKDDDVEFLCDGLTDSLIRQIVALPSSLTVKRGGVFKGKIVDFREAGRKLSVDAIMTGSVARRSGKLYITAEFVDARSGAVLWSGKYDRDQADLLLIQDQIASAMIDEGIRLKLSEANRRLLVRHATNDSEANELYMRAMFYEAKEREGDYRTGRKLLLEAVEKDKNFALAFVALAGNYVMMAVDGYVRPTEAWPLVKLYAEKALVLDPTVLEAHTVLGSEAFWYQWNWALAEQEYKATFSLAGRAWMGYVLERWAVGRPDEALQLIRKARAVDPLDLSWKLREADMLLQTSQTQRSSEIYEEIIRDARDDGRAYFGLAEVRRMQGQFDEAIAQLRLGYEASGERDDSLLEVLTDARGAEGFRQAEKAGAQRELDALVTRASGDQYVSPFDFARAHARLGHKEQVFAYLDAAFADKAPGLVFLKVDHAWDSIRNEQQFRNAVKKVGLP